MLAIFIIVMLIELQMIDTQLLWINLARILVISAIPAIIAGPIKLKSRLAAVICSALVGVFGGPFMAYLIIHIVVK